MYNLWSYFVNHPVFIAALAALASAIFAGVSANLHYRTWRLLQGRARPWLLLEGINNNALFGGLLLTIKNSGEHPAGQISIRFRRVPIVGGERKEEEKEYFDKVAVGGLMSVAFETLGPENYLLSFQLNYKDAITDRTFEEPIFQRYTHFQNLQGSFHTLSKDEQKLSKPLFNRIVEHPKDS
jgi:hypothetical protein